MRGEAGIQVALERLPRPFRARSRIDVDRHRNVAADPRGQGRAVFRDLLRELRKVAHGRVGDEGDPGPPPSDIWQRLPTLDRDPDRGMGRLERSDVQSDRRGPRGVDRDLLPPKRGEQGRVPAVEAGTLLLRGEAERLELDGQVAAPHPEIETARGQPIEERELLGDPDRVVERQDGDHRAEPQPTGPLAERREDEGGGGAEASGVEVVFGDPETG
ncbi:MAG TPA: hypothetical protein VGV64_07955 [Thermoplasmata archaeon]|nr:hypothetical protein [Thermoplasmata archaeon]HEV2429757.1 hypothetical protein [Thermoplasmata archaeon]